MNNINYTLKDLIDELTQIAMENPAAAESPVIINGVYGSQGEIEEINFVDSFREMMVVISSDIMSR